MNLAQLVEDCMIKRIIGDPDIEISGLQAHSGSVQPGDLFLCISGNRVDGHGYIQQAVENGCAAILAEKEVEKRDESIPIVIVPDTRRAMAILANRFYGYPSQQMRLIGVTGTNGKTTTTHMIEHILSKNGNKTGLIGTISMKIGAVTEKTGNTTPDSIALQGMLHRMMENEASHAVLEVSSHALRMGRVRGCNFQTAVFTNLTHDHLDFHQTMSRYLEDKALLFSQLGNSYGSSPKVAILNTDDPASNELAAKTAAQVIRYSIDQPADIKARDIRLNPESTSFWLDTYAGSMSIHLPVVGKFNVYNALAAISACMVEGIALDNIKESLESFTGVIGRLQNVNAGQSFQVFIDYAHNPDGLEKVITAARNITNGKIITLVGCEGDRDIAKRPMMAATGAQLSDKVILTSDNPRSEHPDSILEDMVVGLTPSELSYCEIITNRRDAIHRALELAEPEDCVLITGKGHETIQIFADHQIPFDDAEIAMNWFHVDVESRG